MSLRKYLHLLFACTLLFAIACGGGKEVVDEKELGEDDGAVVENTAGDTAGAAAATPAAAAAPVVADAATLNGLVKFEGAAPKMPVNAVSAPATYATCALGWPTNGTSTGRGTE